MSSNKKYGICVGVLYLGANQDAIATGAKLGVQRRRSLSYNSTDHGTRVVTNSLSRSIYGASSAGGQSVSFTDEDREEAVKDDSE